MEFRDYINNNEYINLPKDEMPIFRPATYAIIEHENKLLCIRDGESNNGLEFPGGGVKLAQELEDALIAEVREETGYDVKITDSIFYAMSDCFYSAKENEYYHGISLFYIATLKSLTQHEQNLDYPNEISEVSWIDINNLNIKQFAIHHQKALKLYMEKRSKNE